MGWRSIVIDRRPHIAGLCHDRAHATGVLIHAYGPHYFRTHDDALLAYLSRFTDWIPGNYYVKARVGGRLYPFPINITTLEMFFGTSLDSSSAERLLESVREDIADPANAEEWVCAKVGREIYEAFYRGYTMKQWGIHPLQLDKSVCGRVPIRLNRDERYVDHQYQLMPRRGFTRMFEQMLEHALIEVRLNTEYAGVSSRIRPRIATVYSGAVDEYFDCRLGRLPWRSLEFQFEAYDQEYRQPCVQINYPDDREYTRSVEIKHVTSQAHDQTVVCYEFPRGTGDPYYPVLSPGSKRLYRAYQELAEVERRDKRVYIAGRLGNFTYINTDEAITRALDLTEDIIRDAGRAPGPD